MAKLEYQVSVLGEDRLRRFIRGTEAELKGHARRLEAVTTRATSRAAKAARPEAGARAFDQLGKVARAEEVKRHREKMRHVAQEARAGVRAEEQRTRAALRGFAEIGRVARQEQFRRDRDAIRTAHRTRGRMARGVVTSARGAGRTVVGIGSMAAGTAAFAGTFAAGNAIREETELRGAASRLANQARAPELKGQLAAEARGIKGATGTEAIGALSSFIELAGGENLDMARRILPELGKVALATGTDLQELAAVAGNAFIPISDKTKDATQQMEMLRSVIAAVAGQGTVGAVEIKDLAREFAGLAASSNKFTGSAEENLKVMGALSQAARQRGGAESASEAVTSVARFSTDLVTKQKELRKMGVEVFADKGRTQLRDPREILVDVLKQTGGDLSKINAVFGERGIRAVQGFAPLFAEAERKAPGTGEAAVRAELARFMNAQLSPAEAAKLAASRGEDPDVRLLESFKKFNQAMADRLLPTVEKAIPQFEKLIPVLGDVAEAAAALAEWFGRNPFTGVVAIIGASIVKDIVAAGIGAKVASTIVSMMGGGAAGQAAGGAAAGAARGRAAGVLGAAGSFATAGIIGGLIGAELGTEIGRKTSEPLVGAAQTRLDLVKGTLSRDDMISRRAQLAEQMKGLQAPAGAFETFAGGLSSLFGGKSTDENKAAAIREVGAAQRELDEALAATQGDLVTQTQAAGQEMLALTQATAQARAELANIHAPPGGMNPRRTNPIVGR